MFAEKILAMPLVAALITLLVRFLVYNYKDYILLPYHFGITTPNTAAETWKETIFWKQRFGFIPEHLSIVAPWYAEYIPPATSNIYVSLLCLFDALSVFLISQWPSSSPQLLYTFMVLNPVMIFLPILESLAPVEHLMLTIIIEICRRRKSKPYLIYFARIIAPALSFYFIAVNLALWFPVGTLSPKIASIGGIFAAIIMGGSALIYLKLWGSVSERTSLYAPPDNGVLWYVRLLIIPVFERCMDVFQIQLPSILILPIAVALPAELPVTTTNKIQPMGSIPEDRQLILVLFSICFSKICRCHLALPDFSIVILFIYSLLDKKKPLNGKKSMFERLQSANVFVPVCAILIVVPLQYSFYTGWVMWDTANPNWVFFPQIVFVIAAGMLVLTFLGTVVDAIEVEGVIEENIKQM